jgi:hypothetical protein
MDGIEKAIEGHRVEEELGFILVCMKPFKGAEKGMAPIFGCLWNIGGLRVAQCTQRSFIFQCESWSLSLNLSTEVL